MRKSTHIIRGGTIGFCFKGGLAFPNSLGVFGSIVDGCLQDRNGKTGEDLIDFGSKLGTHKKAINDEAGLNVRIHDPAFIENVKDVLSRPDIEGRGLDGDQNEVAGGDGGFR